MKQKIFFLLTIALVFLSVGVLADRIITPMDGIIHINPFVAGDNVTAEFGYVYLAYTGDNIDHSPLILRINISSQNDSYPVWKGDFQLSGYIEKYTSLPFWFFLRQNTTRVNLTCSEDSPLTINNPLGPSTINVPNGTFYCYNVSNNLRLDEGDEVFLNIKSNQALWPGQYNLSAKFFYVNDTLAPFVNITNKKYFETHYFKEGDNISVTAKIIENVGLSNEWGLIGSSIGIPFINSTGDDYYFSLTLPYNIQEGNYSLKIFAKDTSGNMGEDNVTLKIDNTGPTIKVLQPTNNSVVSNNLTIELNVTDAKSGVNKSTVQYELAAVVNGSPCPDKGIGLNASCPNTGFVNLPYNSTSGTYFAEVNTTNFTSGSYWLYAKASDNLGNEGVL